MMAGLLDQVIGLLDDPRKRMALEEMLGAIPQKQQNASRGIREAVGNAVSFPREYMETYQPGSMAVDNPAAVDWAISTGAGMVGTPGVSGGALGSSMKSIPELMEFWKGRGVRNYVAERPSRNEIQLSDLVVPKEQRGKGLGSEFMQDLIRIADADGKTVTLTAAKDYGSTSVQRLKDFYKRFGFVENRGRNADYAISDSMYRKPKK
jgi:predicted GNAT family acetyltransferase